MLRRLAFLLVLSATLTGCPRGMGVEPSFPETTGVGIGPAAP